MKEILEKVSNNHNTALLPFSCSPMKILERYTYKPQMDFIFSFCPIKLLNQSY